MSFRTDSHRNPTAFIIQIAEEGGLVEGIDYEKGDSFESDGHTFYTARLLGDPIELTIRVLNKIGFYTVAPHERWVYIAIPYKLWMSLSDYQKKYVIGYMYQNEGGVEMKSLFPNSPMPEPIGMALSDTIHLEDRVG